MSETEGGRTLQLTVEQWMAVAASLQGALDCLEEDDPMYEYFFSASEAVEHALMNERGREGGLH